MKRVIVDIRGGVVEIAQKPRGISVIIRDFDNCPECGGVDCQNGLTRELVHGPDVEQRARLAR